MLNSYIFSRRKLDAYSRIYLPGIYATQLKKIFLYSHTVYKSRKLYPLNITVWEK